MGSLDAVVRHDGAWIRARAGPVVAAALISVLVRWGGGLRSRWQRVRAWWWWCSVHRRALASMVMLCLNRRILGSGGHGLLLPVQHGFDSFSVGSGWTTSPGFG